MSKLQALQRERERENLSCQSGIFAHLALYLARPRRTQVVMQQPTFFASKIRPEEGRDRKKSCHQDLRFVTSLAQTADDEKKPPQKQQPRRWSHHWVLWLQGRG